MWRKHWHSYARRSSLALAQMWEVTLGDLLLHLHTCDESIGTHTLGDLLLHLHTCDESIGTHTLGDLLLHLHACDESIGAHSKIQANQLGCDPATYRDWVWTWWKQIAALQASARVFRNPHGSPWFPVVSVKRCPQLSRIFIQHGTRRICSPTNGTNLSKLLTPWLGWNLENRHHWWQEVAK